MYSTSCSRVQIFSRRRYLLTAVGVSRPLNRHNPYVRKQTEGRRSPPRWSDGFQVQLLVMVLMHRLSRLGCCTPRSRCRRHRPHCISSSARVLHVLSGFKVGEGAGLLYRIGCTIFHRGRVVFEASGLITGRSCCRRDCFSRVLGGNTAATNTVPIKDRDSSIGGWGGAGEGDGFQEVVESNRTGLV